MRRLAIGSALALLLCGGARAAAQDGGVVRGSVTAAETGARLEGVEVELVEAGRLMVTDELGRYEFRGVPEGVHTIRLRLLGRNVVERSIRVTGNRVHVRELALPVTAIGLAPVLVEADRMRLVGGVSAWAEHSGSAHVLTREEIERAEVVFGDVHAVLRRVPGVNVQEEDGYGLRPNIGFRGAGSDRSSKITLMEDGVLIAPAAYSAPAAYYFPMVARMHAVEVLKGASQVRFGPSTVGGALNLVSTPVPDRFTWSVDAAGGGDATRKLIARAGSGEGAVGWLVEGLHIGTDGFKALDGGGDTGFGITDVIGKLRLGRPPVAAGDHSVELKVDYYDEISDETYLGLTSVDFDEAPLRRYAASQEDEMDAEHSQVQLRWNARPTESLDVSVTGYHNTFSRNWYKLQSVGGAGLAGVLDDPEANAPLVAVLRGAESDPGALRVRSNNRKYYAQGVQALAGLRFEGAGRHEVEAGIRLHADQEDRFQHEDAYTMSQGRMTLAAAGAPGSQDNRVGEAKAWAFHLMDRLDLGRVILTPGVRYEAIEFERRDYERGDAERATPTRVLTNDVNELVAGVGAAVLVSPDLRLFGGVHEGFAPPGPGADRQTEPETSVNYELGARVLRPALRAQAVFFFSDYANILGAETLSSGTEGTGNLFNGGAVHSWGFEAGVDADALAEDARWAVPIHFSYTWTRAEFRSAFESEYEAWGTVAVGDELPYLPEHRLHASAGIGRPSWEVGMAATWVSAMRTVAGQGPLAEDASTDAAFVLDASAELAVRPGARLYAGIQNITDDTYIAARRPAGLRPGLPRSLQLGLRLGN